jgi:serine protease inhibitor
MKPLRQGIQQKNQFDMETVVQGNTAFALDLYQKLRTIKGNLFFSPYSISTALAMTYAGARGNTETQMAQTLHFTPDQSALHPAFAALEVHIKSVQEKGNILLQIANALWPHVDYPFLEAFLILTKEFYGVSITPVDYENPEAARQQINTWVEEKTQTKIKELIPTGILDRLTRLVLVNAIYFKGNWASQFAKERTQTAPFLVTPSQKVEAPMMTQEHPFKYGETDRLQILELPYVGNDLSMIVLLPKEVNGLAELETALTAPNLEKWTSRFWETEVRVFLPRFKINQGVKLNGTLASMGMVDAFVEEEANFSGMDGKENWLYIAAVLHKAFVDVNEEGTEAAAATAVVMKLRAPASPPPIFRADHPFVFLIRENSTGSILFLGRVVDPTLKDT